MASWSLFVLYRSGDTPLEEVLDGIRGPLRDTSGEIDETKAIGRMLTEEEKKWAIWRAWYWTFFGPYDVDFDDPDTWELPKVLDYSRAAAAASDIRYSLQLVPTSQLHLFKNVTAKGDVDALQPYVEEGRAKVVLFCSEIA